MTRADYYWKYHKVIFELKYMEKSLRRIAREQKVGLSTVMRLKKRFGLKKKYALQCIVGHILKKKLLKTAFSPSKPFLFCYFCK